jgi:hypothetical protein
MATSCLRTGDRRKIMSLFWKLTWLLSTLGGGSELEVAASLASYVCPWGVETCCPEEDLIFPNPHYLKHPPQYLPPTPQYPLEKELKSLEDAVDKSPRPLTLEEALAIVLENGSPAQTGQPEKHNERVKRLVKEYRELRQKGEWKVALVVARQILELDPDKVIGQRACSKLEKRLARIRQAQQGWDPAKEQNQSPAYRPGALVIPGQESNDRSALPITPANALRELSTENRGDWSIGLNSLLPVPGPRMEMTMPKTQAAGARGPQSKSTRTQIRFEKPVGMRVSWFTKECESGRAVYSTAPLIAPAKCNFTQGAIFQLKLFDIGGRPAGFTVYPTLEIVPSNEHTAEFLAHNYLRVEFSDEDFDQVVDGRYVVKVIYLPHPGKEPAEAASITSTRLESGVDPIAEAQRRGSILAVIRLGAIDQEAPTTIRGAAAAPVTHERQ